MSCLRCDRPRERGVMCARCHDRCKAKAAVASLRPVPRQVVILRDGTVMR